MQRALFYRKHTDKFTSLKHNLLVFQVKVTQLEIKAYQEVGPPNFRHLQPFCSSRAAVLLTCLEDIAQSYPSHSSCCIPEIRTIVLFLPFLQPCPRNRLHLAVQKTCWLVVGKEASTFSTLHGITNQVKSGTTRKIVSSNRCQRPSAV